jgi:hypothetical protein
MMRSEAQPVTPPDIKLTPEYDPSLLQIDFLTETEFSNLEPSLEWYRSLVYALYTEKGVPAEVISAKPPNHTKAHYVIAHHPHLIPLFNNKPRPPLSELSHELTNYNDVAGFFRIEHGITQNGELPIEAMLLLNYNSWPKETPIGYCSQFSPNPLLPKPIRLHVLHQLFERASQFAHEAGFADNLYVILAQHVQEFVQQSGIGTIHQPGATLNYANETARDIFQTWHKYWGNDPQLYKFIPFPKH